MLGTGILVFFSMGSWSYRDLYDLSQITNRRFSEVNSLFAMNVAKSAKAIGGHVSPLRMWESLRSSREGWGDGPRNEGLRPEVEVEVVGLGDVISDVVDVDIVLYRLGSERRTNIDEQCQRESMVE